MEKMQQFLGTSILNALKSWPRDINFLRFRFSLAALFLQFLKQARFSYKKYLHLEFFGNLIYSNLI